MEIYYCSSVCPECPLVQVQSPSVFPVEKILAGRTHPLLTPVTVMLHHQTSDRLLLSGNVNIVIHLMYGKV